MAKTSEKTPQTKSPEQPTLEQWKQLYDIGIELKKLSLWEVMDETDILIIDLPGREEHIYCAVMGEGDEDYAIGIYPGMISFSLLGRALLHSVPSYVAMLDQNCLLCNFGNRDEVEPRDREVMKALDIRFRGSGEWVYFRAVVPGQLPWFINAEQAQLMIDVLGNVLAVCKDYILEESEPCLEPGEGETLRRYYDEEKEAWVNAVVPLPRIPVLHHNMTLGDTGMIARIKRQKKTKMVLEMDWFYLPLPYQEDRNSPAKVPFMSMLVSRETGYCINQQIADEDMVPLTLPPSMLVDYILNHGRPAAVYVRNEEWASLLENTCKAVGVKLVWGKKMSATDRLIRDMIMNLDEKMGKR